MKKLSVLIFLLLFAFAAYGQDLNHPTDKGNMIMGGMLNIMSVFGNAYTNSTTFIITPFMDFFIKDNIMVGGIVQLVMNTGEDVTQTALRIGPTVGYTFKKFKEGEAVEGAFIPFAKIGILIQSQSNKFGDWKATTSGFSIPIGGGFYYMLSRALALVGDINFSLDRMKFSEADEGAGGSRITISLGLAYTKYKK